MEIIGHRHTLVEDVVELVVHRAEEQVIEVVHIIDIKLIDRIEGNLDATLGETTLLCTRCLVDGRRTDKHDHLGAITLHEELVARIASGTVDDGLIDVIPQILGQDSHIHALLIAGRDEIVLHIDLGVRHLVVKPHVVWNQVVGHQESVKRECRRCRVQLVTHLGENSVAKLIIVAGCKTHKRRRQEQQAI